MGERRKLPQRVLGPISGRKRVLEHIELKNTRGLGVLFDTFRMYKNYFCEIMSPPPRVQRLRHCLSLGVISGQTNIYNVFI